MRHSMAWPRNTTSCWVRGRRLPASDGNLQMDEIEAGDELGDGMLDLQAGVHLEEIKIWRTAQTTVGLRLEEKFNGSGIGIAGGLGEADSGLAHAGAQVLTDDRRWSFLDDLLMTTLDGAIALAEIDAVAMFVGEDLYLDVTGVLDELFDVDFAGAKGAEGFAAGSGKGAFHLFSRKPRRACLYHRRRRSPST